MAERWMTKQGILGWWARNESSGLYIHAGGIARPTTQHDGKQSGYFETSAAVEEAIAQYEAARNDEKGGLIPLRFFVKLFAYGTVDSAGKVVFEVGQSSKRIIAEPNAPLAVVVAILEAWQPAWRYSSTEAAKQDLQRLRDYVDGILIEENQT